MRRDILFLVRGVPQNRHFFDKHFFMAIPTEEVVQQLRRLGELDSQLSLFSFLERAGNEKPTCIGFRNEEETEMRALQKASHQLAGIIDGLACFVEEVPEVSKVVQIRERNSPNAKVIYYKEGGWARFHAKTPDSENNWKERNDKLFDRLMLFFDIGAGEDSKFNTDLGYQIRYSAKMFRHGAASEVGGIQFLCKFSALEGLVCGSRQYQKSKWMKDRLSSLLPDEESLDDALKSLWELRSKASHQAMAFYNEFLPAGSPPELEIDLLDYFFVATLVFALDHVQSTNSVEDLWTHTSKYTLPEYARMKRPADMPKMHVTSAAISSPVTWSNAGLLFDECFKKSEDIRIGKSMNPK